jgi:hypothetical protein
MEQFLPLLKPYLEMLLGQHGEVARIVALVVFYMGAARVVFKPLMALVHAVVAVTPSKADDEALAKAESSRAYQVGAFLVDYLFSLKLPVKASPAPVEGDKPEAPSA